MAELVGIVLGLLSIVGIVFGAIYGLMKFYAKWAMMANDISEIKVYIKGYDKKLEIVHSRIDKIYEHLGLSKEEEKQ